MHSVSLLYLLDGGTVRNQEFKESIKRMKKCEKSRRIQTKCILKVPKVNLNRPYIDEVERPSFYGNSL